MKTVLPRVCCNTPLGLFKVWRCAGRDAKGRAYEAGLQLPVASAEACDRASCRDSHMWQPGVPTERPGASYEGTSTVPATAHEMKRGGPGRWDPPGRYLPHCHTTAGGLSEPHGQGRNKSSILNHEL